ncbi:hypothetical protein Tco_1049464 [Tanacetum coccineum]
MDLIDSSCGLREMEAGFLLGKDMSKKNSLASKVKNIEGKILGKYGKPLKSILKSGKVNPNLVNPDSGSCMNSSGHVSNTSLSHVANDNSTHIHDAPVMETVPVADVNASTIISGPNATLGLDNDVLCNDVKVVGADVAIPIAVVDEICDKFANTLYGYFIGERQSFPIVEAYVKNAWAKYGFECAIFRNGFFFFKFSSHDGIVTTGVLRRVWRFANSTL